MNQENLDISALIKGFLVLNRYCVELQKKLVSMGVPEEDMKLLWQHVSNGVTQNDIDMFNMKKYARY